MKLSSLANQPESYIYAERYLNQGTRSYSPFAAYADMEPKYQPSSLTPSFVLPTYKLPHSKVRIYENNPSAWVRKLYLSKDEVIFPVHPEIAADPSVPYISEITKYPAGPGMQVVPTASFRTVFVTKPRHHFIKLHYPKRISRMLRRVSNTTIQIQLAIARDIAHIQHPKFAYFAETLGVTYGDEQAGWGWLLREYDVLPPKRGQYALVPLFALYGQDSQNPSEPPLLSQLIKAAGASPLDFTMQQIIGPIIECWVAAVKERGILLATHGQNSLVEIDLQSFAIGRIVHRDFCTDVDPQIRQAKKLHLDFPDRYIIGRGIESPRAQIYSLIYDNYLGHHLFSYLAAVLQAKFNVPVIKTQAEARKIFQACFPEAADIFPPTIYYYGNKILPNNNYVLINQHQKPVWR